MRAGVAYEGDRWPGLMEVIRRGSLSPAQILAESVPAMARKGRIQTGADANVVVFDSNTVTDPRDLFRYHRTVHGIRLIIIVNGVELVSESRLRVDQLPGRPIRA
jgi:hypothetical protein